MLTTLFLADISGFTEFVNETEIIHGQEIIIDLLETIIDKNNLPMKIYEIEGDAVIFADNKNEYNPIRFTENAKQMFASFKSRIDKIDNTRNCSCGACQNIRNLSLKFIVHRSSLSEIKIKNFEKMYGLGLIVAHLLLKNDLGKNEYVLFTNEYLDKFNEPIIDLRDYTHIDSRIGEIKTKYLEFKNE